jgi:hypothetical protein
VVEKWSIVLSLKKAEKKLWPPHKDFFSQMEKFFQNCDSCGLYYKNITIVNDTSRVVRMMIISDAPSCGITYGCHSDESSE